MTKYMKAGKSPKLAALMGTLLVTTSCSAIDIFHTNEPAPQTSEALVSEEGQLLRYCKKLHRNSDLVVAAGMCQRAHEVDPSDPEPLLELGVILNKLGQRQQAVQAYRSVLKSDPGNAEARYGLGKTYIGMGQHDLATNQFSALLNEGHHDPRIYNAAGVAEGLKGDHLAAQAMFQRGLEKTPNDIKLRNNLGLAYVNNRDFQQGIAHLEATANLPIADATTKRNLQIAYNKAQAAGYSSANRQNVNAMPQHAEVGIAPVQVQELPPASNAPVTPASLQSAQAFSAASPAAPTTPPRRIVPSSEIGKYRSAEIGDVNNSDGPIQLASRGDSDMDLIHFQSAELPKPESTQDKEPGSPELAKTFQITPAAGDYAVQLAAFRDKETAETSWNGLKNQAPDLLDKHQPMVLRADLGAEKGIYYRLRTGNMARQAAETLCSDLQARSMDCMVVRATRQSAPAS
jgi:Flp pilus assembly protein TadD